MIRQPLFTRLYKVTIVIHSLYNTGIKYIPCKSHQDLPSDGLVRDVPFSVGDLGPGEMVDMGTGWDEAHEGLIDTSLAVPSAEFCSAVWCEFTVRHYHGFGG